MPCCVDPSGLYRIMIGDPPGNPKTGYINQLPVFGTTWETIGVLNPGEQYPGTEIANIWGSGEAVGVKNYWVPGCNPKEEEVKHITVPSVAPDRNPGDEIIRTPTSSLPDRSVDIVIIRGSPFRCCELREICRICKPGCLVTLTLGGGWFNEVENLGPSDYGQWLDLLRREDCLGDRLGSFGHPIRPLIVDENGNPDLDEEGKEFRYYGVWFTLKEGYCPGDTCPDSERPR